MAVCEVCGNDYDKSFEVIAAGQRHVFDSFECAVHRMAPVCEPVPEPSSTTSVSAASSSVPAWATFRSC